MSFFDTQNPGIGGLDELTDSEALLVQSLNALGDPNADRILFWDDSAGGYRFLTLGTNLSITNTTIDATGGASGITIGTTTITSGTNTRILYNNAGVVGEYTLTGSGTVVVMQTAPTFATSITTPSVLATANDSGALGASGTAFADLFLASGGVINWNAGASTLTHSLNTLTIGGSGATTLALGTNSLTMTGSIAATGARVTKGWFTDIESTNMPTVGGTAILTSLTAPQFTTIELGHASDTTLSRSAAGVLAVEGIVVPTISSTSTITNKRNQPRVTSAASYTTNTGSSLDVSTTDIFIITAQAGALLFNNPGGTPVQGERLVIRIKDNGTARALTWDTQFRAMGTALPSTTVLSKTLYLGFFYNSTDTKWDLVASAQEA